MTTSPNLKLILWYHDRIEIDTSSSVMAVTPQTPKCHHNLGCASVVVTFGSLWCHSHDLKLGINSFNIDTLGYFLLPGHTEDMKQMIKTKKASVGDFMFKM